MPYKFYRRETIPCPNCVPCAEHSHNTPRLPLARRFFVKNDDGTETPLTEEEYNAWDAS